MKQPGYRLGAPNLGIGNEALVASNGAWQVTVALMEAAASKNLGR